MARKLSPEEQAKTRTDFDAPDAIAKRDDRQKPDKAEKKHTGKGNPNGRPPSLTPRNSTMTIRLTDATRERLETAARILDTTKTNVIVEGIDLVYLQAKREERQRAKGAE